MRISFSFFLNNSHFLWQNVTSVFRNKRSLIYFVLKRHCHQFLGLLKKSNRDIANREDPKILVQLPLQMLYQLSETMIKSAWLHIAGMEMD